jgi:hypothetical protein
MKLPVDLQAGESVVLRVRRHPVYVIAKLDGVVLVGVVPIALALWLGFGVAGAGGILATVLAAACALWGVYWLVRGYFVWFRHHHDEWIVTNQRLLDAYKRHWFDQQLASADLINLQDISVHRSGLLATVFNFGDVRCETAGERSAFVLSAVPRPSAVLSTIDATRDAARQDVAGGGPRHPRAFPEPDDDGPPIPDAVPRQP